MEKNVFTTEELKEIIDNLYGTIGVRMNVDRKKYPLGDALHDPTKFFWHDVMMVTDHLELPVCVRPVFSSAFAPAGLVHNQGNYTSEVGAQIQIPGNLPWYKTEAMKNFPIDITVPPEVLTRGYEYVTTLLSHEFSHIYLHSRRDPQKDSEWATDLCALMMGFGQFWIGGRTRCERTKNHTITHRQGYLSDDGFAYALNYISGLRSPFERLSQRIVSAKNSIQAVCDDIPGKLKELFLLYEFHLHHPQKAFKRKEDAAVFARLAQSGQYKSDVEDLLRACKSEANVMISTMKGKKEFYERDKRWMQDNIKGLTAIGERLKRKLGELENDYSVLIDNIDVTHYTYVFETDVKDMTECVNEFEKVLKQIHQRTEVLNRCLLLYNCHKKKTRAEDVDAKTLSLLGNNDYAVDLAYLVDEQHKKIKKVEDTLRAAYKFYIVDDKVLSSRKKEANEALSTLKHCLKEQENHIEVVKRNLNFPGRIKWALRWFFT